MPTTIITSFALAATVGNAIMSSSLGSCLILLIIGFIGMIVNKQKRRSSRWPDWVIMAGGCAILTSIFNSMKLH